MGLYVQYGCGLSAPDGWRNFDASPTLRIQKIPLVGVPLVKSRVVFPKSVLYGDIVKGLPGIENNSCDGIYCSHVLEHLSLRDFRTALNNTYRYLKPGGIFRCVVPDLECSARSYVEGLDKKDENAAHLFFQETLLGQPARLRGFKNLIIGMLGGAHYLWMWDQYSLSKELRDVGFTSIRNCTFNDSKDLNFTKVESEGRFRRAVAIECAKPNN